MKGLRPITVIELKMRGTNGSKIPFTLEGVDFGKQFLEASD